MFSGPLMAQDFGFVVPAGERPEYSTVFQARARAPRSRKTSQRRVN